MFDNDVGVVAAGEVNVFIDDGERNLAIERQIVVGEFPAETFLVDGLEETGSQFFVNLDREANDSFGGVRGRINLLHG